MTARIARPATSDSLLGAWLLMLAGFFDAIAFVVLHGNFVAFMTGSTTVLGSSIGTGRWGVVGLTGLLIVLFFTGNVAGASIVRWCGRTAHTTLMISIVAVMLTGAIVASTASVWAGTVLLAVAGGLINSALATNTDVHVGLTFVTGTLVKAAHQLVAGIGTGRPFAWVATLGFWFAFAGGAALGGWAYHAIGTAALWIAAAMAAIACFLPHRSEG